MMLRKKVVKVAAHLLSKHETRSHIAAQDKHFARDLISNFTRKSTVNLIQLDHIGMAYSTTDSNPLLHGTMCLKA